MVIIHPTATHKLHVLTALQTETGRQIVRGNTFLRLVPRDGTDGPIQRSMPRPTSVSSFSQGPTGGDAA